ncbi:pyridoxal 5'-phosphate synthase [Gordonia sp. ABSL11-1]|uniref:pyridoxal 5'-phosphate synthase n=1 Tax=Gordonia sp. ABSL11-1 TaxID=3053924 RepID=UPI00257471BC|nr:pyridoxal 5'-phosphate synthase [Gordonia sp. ABSL11-1]MDL9947217.1 pyridoxal 5'-phosphate synthase [Gordonia sp. ABSL11-1]
MAPTPPNQPGDSSLTGDATLQLPEFDTPPQHPLQLLQQWSASAAERHVREPSSAVLATASDTISTRVVSVKDITSEGIVFTSFADSRKGRDLDVRPFGAVNFYWRETLQQVNLSGPIDDAGDETSDRLFAERPRQAQATTAVSHQSHRLDDENHLRAQAHELLASTDEIPRPERWRAFVLRPVSIEFWYGSPDRLHRRLVYERPVPTADWSHRRLQP